MYLLIVVLLMFFGVSTYADGVDVRGYPNGDCTGEYLQVESYEDLWNYHKKTTDGKYWEFESYNYVVKNPDCYKFKTNEVVIVASITNDDGNSGGSSTPSKGFENPDQPSGQGGSTDPLDILTDADNVAKHLCWLEKAKKLEKIKNWVGDDTDATWKGDHAETKERWRVKATDEIEALYGLTNYPYPEEVATKNDVFIVVRFYCSRYIPFKYFKFIDPIKYSV